MILYIYKEGRVYLMNNEDVFTISQDVIDECLADSIEKASK